MRAFQTQAASMKIHLGGRNNLPAKTFQATDGVVSFDGDDLAYADDLEKLMKSGTRPDLTQQIREMDAGTVDAYRKQQEAKKRPAAQRGIASTGTDTGRNPTSRALGQKSVPAAGAAASVVGTEAKHVDTMPGAQSVPNPVPARDPGTRGPNAAGDAASGADLVNAPPGSDIANRVEATENSARNEEGKSPIAAMKERAAQKEADRAARENEARAAAAAQAGPKT